MKSKKIKKLMCSIFTATLLLSGVPEVIPAGNLNTVQTVEAASKVKLSKNSLSMNVGSSYKLSLKGVSGKNKKKITWKSNSSKLQVSTNKSDKREAVLKPSKAGTYSVSAKYDGKTYKCSVRVLGAVKLNKTSASIKVGKSTTLKVANPVGKVKWSVTNTKGKRTKNVALKVSKNTKSVKITGKKKGTYYVYATVSGRKLKSKIRVTSVVVPVVVPTATPVPTTKPTEAPKPTAKPTEVPKPSVEPTKAPEPTKVPKPTATPKPSVEPTKVPKPTATPKPTEAPKPTETPSVEPTATPTPGEDDGKPVLNSFSVNANSLTLEEGESFQLEAYVDVTPDLDEYKKVKWEEVGMFEDGADYVDIDSNGLVTAKKVGYTAIWCTTYTGRIIEIPVTITAKKADVPTSGYTYNVTNREELEDANDMYGSGRSVIVTTNAPADKIYTTVSNGNLRFLGTRREVYKDEYKYCFTYIPFKKGTCDISVYLDDKLMDKWSFTIVGVDSEYDGYDEWFNQTISKMGAKWSGADPLNKLVNLGQYLLDNYDYSNGWDMLFHIDGSGSCATSADVLVRTAMGLGLRAEVVTPANWAVSDPTHVVARVWYNGKAYLIDAGNQGKAGNRGSVSCVAID